jgi:large subunit ribosomal protein L33
MAKKNTVLVKLTSSGLNAKGKPTGTFFVKKRNPKKNPNKLSFRKYDPRAVYASEEEFNSTDAQNDNSNDSSSDGDSAPKSGKHVVFLEKKMPPHSK